MMPEDLPNYGPPDAVMRGLAIELASLKYVAANLEDCLSEVIQKNGYATDLGSHRQLMQDFDLLTQSLDGLREFVDQLATAAQGRPSIRLIEALASVKLGDMRERLANPDEERLSRDRKNKATPIDLF